MKGLCPAPIADHEVEWGGVLGVDEGAMQADGAPAGVGHLSLVPEAKKKLDLRSIRSSPRTGILSLIRFNSERD